ncbi:hypothetical protein J1614_005942 [Plenodomus biglobosus]|nr:hypothetical protein J1614_005942 [Plenodomus biglobosus]
MDPNGKQSRKTNIIDDAVALEYSLAQKGKSKSKGNARARATAGPSALEPRTAGISKSKGPNKTRAAPTVGPQYYEGHGLKISLYDKGGKQRPHARASITFRNKNIEAALEIVESYAGSGKRHQFKNESKSKLFIGNWIEMAETLAFGANPSTKLTSANWAASEFTYPTQAPQSLASTSVPNNKNNKKIQQIPVDDDDLEDAMNEIYSSLRNKRNLAPDQASDQNDNPKKQKRDHSANSQPLYKSPATNAVTAKLDIGKRIPDNACTLTPTNANLRQEIQNHKSAEQQARERRNMVSEPYNITDSHRGKKPDQGTKRVFSAQDIMDASNEAPKQSTQTRASRVPVSSYPTPATKGNKGIKTLAEEQDRLRIFTQGIGLDPRNAESATTVLPGPAKGERQILTVSESTSGQLTLHSTTISRPNFDNLRSAKPNLRPYLKDGKHGPGGKFDNDPDRATGNGHDYEPEDAWNFSKYLEIKSKAGERYPDGKPMFPQAVQALRDLEPWYVEYVKQYPGKRLDQWPCGCMKVVEEDRDESEEE